MTCVSVGVNVTDRANLSLAYATQTTWERVRINVIALKQSVGVGRGALSMSAGHSFCGELRLLAVHLL